LTKFKNFVIIYFVANPQQRKIMETRTVDKLFESENNGNPFQRESEEMLLWEYDPEEDEAHTVFRARDKRLFQDVMLRLQTQNPGLTYHVEFPNRKGERDGVKMEKRKKPEGAKCLPNARQQTLLTAIENRWGAALDESAYMESRGKRLAFFMRTDATRETVFEFDNWNDVAAMAYAPR